MKKLFSLIVAVVMLLVMVCGCEEDKKTTSKTSSVSSTSEVEISSDITSEDVESNFDDTEETVEDTVTDYTETSQMSETTTSSDEETEEDPDKAVRERMQGGINFNGMDGTVPDKSGKAYYYDREYYALVAEAGFNNIRLPVSLGSMIVSDGPEYLLDQELLRYLDNIINAALDEGLIIAIDNHHGSCYAEKDKFVRIWEQIAERYQFYPAELIFELCNEPNGYSDELVNENQMAAVKAIRKTNPTRNIVIAPNQWNGSWKLWDAQCPSTLDENGQIKFDSNVIFAVHMYNPMSFTHCNMNGGNSEAHLKDDDLASVKSALKVCADYEERTGRHVWINFAAD